MGLQWKCRTSSGDKCKTVKTCQLATSLRTRSCFLHLCKWQDLVCGYIWINFSFTSRSNVSTYWYVCWSLARQVSVSSLFAYLPVCFSLSTSFHCIAHYMYWYNKRLTWALKCSEVGSYPRVAWLITTDYFRGSLQCNKLWWHVRAVTW